MSTVFRPLPDGFWVYVAYDVDSHPLYVGKTRRPTPRMGQHAQGSGWWDEAHRIEFHQLRSQREMDSAERQAINDLWPRDNQALIGYRLPGENALRVFALRAKIRAGAPYQLGDLTR